MEVMGLMLGEFVDDYTVRVIDVFAMPQSGTVCLSFVCLFVCACVCMCSVQSTRPLHKGYDVLCDSSQLP